jgi:hypothetical protein
MTVAGALAEQFHYTGSVAAVQLLIRRWFAAACGVGCLQVTVRKGDSIGVFLKAVREQLAPQFRELRAVSVDNMMYIKVGGKPAGSQLRRHVASVHQPMQQQTAACRSRGRAGCCQVTLYTV